MKNLKKVLAVLLSLICLISCITISGALDTPEESESNNSLKDADELTLLGIKGHLDANEDVDIFKFYTSEAGLLNVYLEHEVQNSPLTYFRVEILDKNGDRIASQSVNGNEKETLITACCVAANEEGEFYYIKVAKGQVYDKTVNYVLRYKLEPNPFSEEEPNNDAEHATGIKTGVLDAPASTTPFYTATLTNTEDVDFFKFDITDPCYFYVYLIQDTNPNQKINYKVEISGYAPDKYTQFSDRSKIGTFDALTTDSVSISPSVGASKGTYYIRVSTSEEFNSNIYMVGVVIRSFTNKQYPVEQEPNNRHINADYISLDKGIIGSNFDYEDKDWYSVNIGNDKVYGFEFSCLSKVDTERKWNIKIYKATDFVPDNLNYIPSPVAEINPTSSNSNNKFEFLKGEYDLYDSGLYYICVTSTQYLDSPADYLITMTNRAKPEQSESFWSRLGSIFFGFFDSPLYTTFVSLLNNMDLLSAGVVMIMQLLNFIPNIDWGTIGGWIGL